MLRVQPKDRHLINDIRASFQNMQTRNALLTLNEEENSQELLSPNSSFQSQRDSRFNPKSINDDDDTIPHAINTSASTPEIPGAPAYPHRPLVPTASIKQKNTQLVDLKRSQADRAFDRLDASIQDHIPEHDFPDIIASSASISSIYVRRDTEGKIIQQTMMRAMKMRPIFGDRKIARFSANYFLYLEFFRVIIRMLFSMFIFSLICYTTYYILLRNDIWDLDVEDNQKLAYTMFIIAFGIVLTILSYIEEARVANHSILYELQWTEDLFSLLVLNIPLNVGKRELAAYFNEILREEAMKKKRRTALQADREYVREVIMIQDYYKYTKIKDEIKKVSENLASLLKKKVEGKKVDMLTRRQQELEDELERVESELREFNCFKGKAIVIFDTIAAKDKILTHFSPSIFVRPFICCFKRGFGRLFFKGNRLFVKEIPEPQDFIFENIYYPAAKRISRTLFVYFATLIVIVAVLVMTYFQVNHLLEYQFQNKNVDMLTEIKNYEFSALIVVLGLIFQYTYVYIRSFLIYTSKLDADMNILDYTVGITLLLYLGVQSFYEQEGMIARIEQLLILCVVNFLKVLILEAIAIYIASGKMEKLKDRLRTGSMFSNLLGTVYDLYVQFDFIGSLTCVLPLMFLGFALSTLKPLIVIPIILVSVYIIAIIDKYRMLRCCNIFLSKSALYMLKAFKVFRWTPFLTFAGSVLIIIDYYVDVSQREVHDTFYMNLTILFLLSLVLAVLSLVNWVPSLDSKVKAKFAKRHGRTSYEIVCNRFSSFYVREDPWNQVPMPEASL